MGELECREDLQESLITETNAGIPVTNPAHLKEVLIDFYNEFNKEGRINCNSVGIEKYSQEMQVKKFSKILIDRIAGNSNN